jgi:hypothetical protein
MATTYQLISSSTLASPAATFSFTAIPQIYTDLAVKCMTRFTGAAVDTWVTFNANGSGIYSVTTAKGNNNVGSGNSSAQIYFTSMLSVDNGWTANTFSSTDIYIPNYTLTQFKQINVASFTENNSSDEWYQFGAGLMQSTTAVTSIEFFSTSTSFATNSTFSLYGIKNS